MPENKITTQQELHVNPYETAVKEHIPVAGDCYVSKSPSYNSHEIIILKERSVDERGNAHWTFDAVTGHRWSNYIGDGDLKSYYRPILGGYERVRELADLIMEGKADQVALIIGGEQQQAAPDTEALMATESPEHILALLDEAERAQNALREARLMADALAEAKKAEMQAMLDKMNDYLGAVREKVANLMKVITILNLYTGQTIDVEQITDGEAANPKEPLHLRQRILYMDEELCVHLDHEADYQDIVIFKEWLKEPGNRDVVIPEPRCVVTLKPKRFDMSYRSGDSLYDRQRNEWNKHTYVLIRNGERLYLLDSEDLEVYDWAFPHSDFEEEYAKKMSSSDRWERELADAKHKEERYRTTKYMVFMQGLIDGGNILSPMSAHLNLIKAEGVVLVRDDEDLLGTGRKPWREFVDEKNTLIRRGTRILYTAGAILRDGINSRPWNSGGEFITYYRSEYTEPATPATGIYHADTIEVTDHYENHKPVYVTAPYLVFRYNPGDKVFNRTGWDWEGHERKNRIPWKYSSSHVLNYDAVSLEELRGYMEDRTMRVAFAGMMPTLKKILLLKEEERRDEQDFKTLLADTILKETGKTVSDERLDAAIEWWKTKVIYSRPLRSDDAKAFRMIKGRVLNKKIE